MNNICSVMSAVENCATILKQLKASCVTAESCTGGGISQAMTQLPGSSDWFERGFVTYSNQAKQEMLDVPEKIIKDHGAVSQETAKAMAEGALKQSQSNFSVAVTGIAGPDGGSKEKPVGTVWIAWAGGLLKTRAQCFHFKGDRASVREQTILHALSGLYERLEESTKQQKAKGRYFFALWPDKKTADALFQVAEQVVDSDKGKLTQKENLHLTLLYLGHITTDFLSNAISAAQKIKPLPFDLQIDGVNDWSNVKVRYLSLTDSPDPLYVLVRQLNQALLEEGFKPERRSFVPHITVARRSQHQSQADEIEPLQWSVQRFCLVCANGDEENKYKIIERFDVRT